MLKKAFVLVLILLPIWLLAQDMPFTVKSSTKYSASGMIGYEKVDSVKYLQFRFIQEYNYKKFGIGLDLDFLFDKHYNLKKSDWDQWKDALNKIYYIRYGEYGDPIYFHEGGFPNRTMENGLVMKYYSNMLLYPELRNPGVMLGGSLNWNMKPAFEAFTSNIQTNEILAFSAHIKPIPDSTFKNVDQTILGFTIVTDRNQKGNLEYTMADSLFEQLDVGSSDPVTEFSIDYTMPMLQSEKVTLGHYAEVANIINNGTGFILPGLYADFNFLKVNLEYRMYTDHFLPAFFDHFYEEQRAVYIPPTDSTDYDIITKESTLKDINSSYGWYGKVQGFIGRKLKALVAWQDMYGKDLKTGKSLWLRFWVDTQYKRLEKVSFAYSKTNVEKLALGKVVVPSAQMGFTFTFSLNDKRRWFIIGKYSERYKDKEGGINWWEDTKRSAAVGVKYTF